MSEAGRMLVDLLHPDCRDADLPGHWLDPETGLWKPGCEPAIDE